MNAISSKVKIISNHSGSALLIVLILMGAAISTTLIIMQNSASLSQIYARKAATQTADNVSQMIYTMMADPQVCAQGFDGAGSESGLQFLNDSNGVTTFDLAKAQSASGQRVSIPSNLRDASGSKVRLFAGEAIPGTNLTLDNLVVRNSTPPVGGAYDLDLTAQYTAVQNGTQVSLSPRSVMKIRAVIAGGNVSTCELAPSPTSNQSLCEGMNCQYTVSTTTGEGGCYCKVQPMSCQPGHFVQSVFNYVPQCSSAPFSVDCGPGAYLVALDATGGKVCANVVTCPAGTSSTGLGGPTSPPECRCPNAGETWNGSACAVAVAQAGACGPANNQPYSFPPSTTQLCSIGTPASFAGSGPWTWTCNGINGGGPATCSTIPSGGAPCITDGNIFYIDYGGCPGGVFAPPSVNFATISPQCCSGTTTRTCDSMYDTFYTCSAGSNVTGACGSANGFGTVTQPSINLCSAGTVTPVSGATADWTWSCLGSGTGTDANCSAPKTATAGPRPACVCWSYSGFGGSTIVFESTTGSCMTGPSGGMYSAGKCWKTLMPKVVVDCADPAATIVTNGCSTAPFCKERCEPAGYKSQTNSVVRFAADHPSQAACLAAIGYDGKKTTVSGGADYYKFCQPCADLPGYWQEGISFEGNHDPICY